MPEGLHYQMDFETGIKQAKLLDKLESHLGLEAVAVVEGKGRSAEVLAPDTKKLYKVDGNEDKKFEAALTDLQILFANMDIASTINEHYQLIDTSLEALVYSSYDLDYGHKIVKDNRNVALFFSVVKSNAEAPLLKEKILRIISSSIRNNEDSLKDILSHNKKDLFVGIEDIITQEINNKAGGQTLIKRCISILNALIYDPQGLQLFESMEVKQYLNDNKKSFDNDTKRRIADLFDDLNNLELRFNSK